MTILSNPNIAKRDGIAIVVISRCMKQKYATFIVKVSEMSPWAAGGKI